MTCRCGPNKCGKCDERPLCPKCQSPDLAPYRSDDPSWRWFAAITPGTDKAVVCVDCGHVAWPGSRQVDQLQSVLDAQERRAGPRIDDDPVVVAKQWNGDCGNREPDFDMDPDDTASFLAFHVIRMRERVEQLLTAKDEACAIAERCHGPECDWGNECSWNKSERIIELKAVGHE